jgi:hypothetical protein
MSWMPMGSGCSSDVAHLRQVHFRTGRHSTETMELWDFGLTIDELDWLRVPTYQTPED